jgi:hypothetical protein
MLSRSRDRGSNPAHWDGKRKTALTESAEVFAVPLLSERVQPMIDRLKLVEELAINFVP